MGEKSGSLWMIVIVIVIVSILVIMMTPFFRDAVSVLMIELLDTLNEQGIIDTSPGVPEDGGDGGEIPEAS